MCEKKIIVNNSAGLHNRAAINFIEIANQFKSKVWVKNGSAVANAKSLLGVLSLCVEQGDHITIMAEGCDMEEAIDTLSALIISTNECSVQ